MIRIAIDPNVRVRGDLTFSGFEEIEGDFDPSQLSINEDVIVFEPETGAQGHGRISDVSLERRLVYLEVEWKTLAPPARPAGATR